MVKPTPTRFNPDLLARDSTQYSVDLPVSQFSRLSALLLEPDGSMTATFRFSRRKKNVLVAGTLKATFTLECQRCLESMAYDIQAPFELVFAQNEAAAQAMPEEMDPVILDDNGQIHIVDLFEDELILHLPTVARHAQSDSCVVIEQATGDVAGNTDEAGKETENEGQADTDTQRRPFDILKNLDLH